MQFSLHTAPVYSPSNNIAQGIEGDFLGNSEALMVLADPLGKIEEGEEIAESVLAIFVIGVEGYGIGDLVLGKRRLELLVIALREPELIVPFFDYLLDARVCRRPSCGLVGNGGIGVRGA